MVSQEKMKYVYIIGNIFVNTQSFLKILAPKCNVFNVYYICRKTSLQVMKVKKGHNCMPQ